MLVLAIIACSDNVSGSSEDPNVLTAETDSSSGSDVKMSSSVTVAKSSSSKKMESSSSASKKISSSSTPLVLCKAGGYWDGCAKFGTGGEGDLWPYTGSKNVHTKAYAEDSAMFGEHAGELYFETDSLEGGKTQIFWNDGTMSSEDNYFGNGHLSATVKLDKGSLSCDPYFNLGFYVAGFDSNGVALSADISNWNGICIMYKGSISPTLQLDLGDSLNQKLGYALPAVTMVSSEDPQCYEWNQFKQPDSEKEYEIISGEDAAKHVVKVVFHFQAQPNEEFEGFDGINIIAIGTNRE